MEAVVVYKCLCDRTRLRILNLLSKEPLCVCHLQSILNEQQVKLSKHLAYLRKSKLVTTRRHGQWVIYSLPDNAPSLLLENLKCLQDLKGEDKIFQQDIKRLKACDTSVAADNKCC